MQRALADKTLILVTHKASLLPLVDRVIVLEEDKVLLDGPRQEVVQKMTSGTLRPAEERPTPSLTNPGGGS